MFRIDQCFCLYIDNSTINGQIEDLVSNLPRGGVKKYVPHSLATCRDALACKIH